MKAEEIKGLGAIWGKQNGLLSTTELETLMWWLKRFEGPLRVLEVGHYLGLSTCGIIHALRGREAAWKVTSLDAHCSDDWVPATNPSDFEANREQFFKHPNLTTLYERSQTLVAPLPYDFIFYDGDHGEEQERFTKVVLASPDVRIFLFDDRDFEFPSRCEYMLKKAGWTDLSPVLSRRRGDKTNPMTQTIAVFHRPALF